MQPYLRPIIAAARLNFRSCPHVQRGSQIVPLIDEAGHHGVANGLTSAPALREMHSLRLAEVQLPG